LLDASFAILLELKDDRVPSVTHGEVCQQIHQFLTSKLLTLRKDPPPWIPAEKRHTTAGVSSNAELHMVRAVDTGIINVRLLHSACPLIQTVWLQISLAVQESEEKLRREKERYA
jgi:mitotic spindle assembly checkpoint protein MAD2B